MLKALVAGMVVISSFPSPLLRAGATRRRSLANLKTGYNGDAGAVKCNCVGEGNRLATGVERQVAAGTVLRLALAIHWLGKPVVAGLPPRRQRPYRRGYDASPRPLVHRNRKRTPFGFPSLTCRSSARPPVANRLLGEGNRVIGDRGQGSVGPLPSVGRPSDQGGER